MTEEVPAFSSHVWHGGRMVRYQVDDRRRPGSRPAILVVIPYYNAAAWIDACLDHLAEADEPHDILIVDDGSKEPLALPHRAKNIVLCRFEHNAGLISALNFAASFALAQGYTYYVRQDADDLSRPDRLKLQRAAMEREQADLVVAGVRAVDESGTLIWSGRISEDLPAFRNALAQRNPVVHSTWFVRTALFAVIGCYDERFRGAEDFELLQRIARHGKIAIVPDELVDYLVHPGSVLSGSREPAVQTLRIVARYFEPARPAAYAGIVRAAAAAAVSRRWKVAVRRLLSRAKA